MFSGVWDFLILQMFHKCKSNVYESPTITLDTCPPIIKKTNKQKNTVQTICSGPIRNMSNMSAENASKVNYKRLVGVDHINAKLAF